MLYAFAFIIIYLALLWSKYWHCFQLEKRRVCGEVLIAKYHRVTIYIWCLLHTSLVESDISMTNHCSSSSSKEDMYPENSLKRQVQSLHIQYKCEELWMCLASTGLVHVAEDRVVVYSDCWCFHLNTPVIYDLGYRMNESEWVSTSSWLLRIALPLSGFASSSTWHPTLNVM